ncbi:unnamed protein product [Owenia fusiformis]|uniref:Uncharacterized protein n=1 Tax=Owenia fusiformis TaxID=6347 RepID=A0A8J1U4K0_OWEFU|nr:unnamed protein product [Owenia fusiformis]
MTTRTNTRITLSCKPAKVGYSEINKTVESKNRVESQMLEFQQKHLELSKNILSADINKAQETMRKRMERLKLKLEDSKKRRKQKHSDEKIRVANDDLRKDIDPDDQNGMIADPAKKQASDAAQTPPNSVTFGSNPSIHRSDTTRPRNGFAGGSHNRNNSFTNIDLLKSHNFRDVPGGLSRNNSFHGSMGDIPSRPGSRNGSFHRRSNTLPLGRSDSFTSKRGPGSISSIRSSKSSSSGSSAQSVYKVKHKRTVHYQKFEVIDVDFPLTAPEAISSVRRQRGDSLLSSRSRHLNKAMDNLEATQKSHREEENEMHQHIQALEQETGLTLNIKRTTLSPRTKDTRLETPLPPNAHSKQNSATEKPPGIKMDSSTTTPTMFIKLPENVHTKEKFANVTDGDLPESTTPAQLKVHLALPNITLQNKEDAVGEDTPTDANMGSITAVTTLPGILKTSEINDNRITLNDRIDQSPTDMDGEIDEMNESARNVRIYSLPKINIYCEIEENPFDVGQIPEPSRPRDLIDDVPEDKMYAWLGFESQEQLDTIQEAKRVATERAAANKKQNRPALPKLEESPETPIDIRPHTADLISTKRTVGTKEDVRDRFDSISTDSEEEDEELTDQRFEVFDKDKIKPKKQKSSGNDKIKAQTLKMEANAKKENAQCAEKLAIVPTAMHINSAREKFRVAVKTVLAVKYFNMLPPGRDITSSKSSGSRA